MSNEEKIKSLFDEYDTNKNGSLEKVELCAGLNELIKSLGESLNPEEINFLADESIEKFDLDKNGKIELNEFKNLINFLIEEKGLQL